MQSAAEYIRDSDCTAETPVRFGQEPRAIYGKGIIIKPRVDGRRETKYEKKTHLSELFPLEDYDRIIVLFSGGKDSLAALIKLYELGVPKDKISIWHHDVDGRNADRKMDWPCTQSYVRSIAEAEGLHLQISWREHGFWGEVYRVGSSNPIRFSEDGKEYRCALTEKQARSDELRAKLRDGLGNTELLELMSYGYRMKFPAKNADLMSRWCSSILKITVAEAVLRNLAELQGLGTIGKFPAKGSVYQGRWCSATVKARVADGVLREIGEPDGPEYTKILLVSGERRGESASRARYNEMEVHRTNAIKKARRVVHQWRAVIDHSEKDIWTAIRRHNFRPHPCYEAGWNRCSCMLCIFSQPHHWAGIRELFPKEYEAVRRDEEYLGFTLDNRKNLDEYVGDAKSCVNYKAKRALHQIITGEFAVGDVYVEPGKWHYPAGAFHGAGGGPC